MKVYYFPSGMKNSFENASSRLRIYFLQDWLRQHDIQSSVQGERQFFSPLNADIIVFQLRNFNLKLAKNARAKNIHVVYDITDIRPLSRRDLKIRLRETDVVVTLNEAIKDFVSHAEADWKHYKIIRDCIDYIKTPLPSRVHQKKTDLEIVFSTNPASLINIRACILPLMRLHHKTKFKFTCISGKQVNLNSHYKGITEEMAWLTPQWVDWNFNTFVNNFKLGDMAIAPQSKIDKPETKIRESIALNIPIVSSKIPSHWKVATDTNTTEFCCENSDIDSWHKALEKLCNPEVRNDFLAKTVPYIWKNYSIEAIGSQWQRLFVELVNKK